jgi:putative drug exporter of the RND superfamily
MGLSRVLSAVGGWSHAHRRAVIVGWLGVVVALGVGAGTLHGVMTTTFSVSGTQSQKALDLLAARFPGAGGADARIVFAAPAGRSLAEPRYRGVIGPTVALARQVPQTLPSPTAFRSSLTLSHDHRIAFADLHFVVPAAQLAPATRAALRRVAAPARRAGLTVAFSGAVLTSAGHIPETAELIGVVVAIIVLLVGFGSLMTAVLPIATALVGVAIGVFGVALASGFTSLNTTTPTLATMLGLAVGIDYAVFIVARHRQQVRDGMPIPESVATAVATAGSAVAVAGTTVLVALLGMLVIGIPFLDQMGIAAAATVAVAVLVAVTLVPALLGFVGARVATGRGSAGSRRWPGRLTRHPAPPMAAVVVGLLLVCGPAVHMSLALPGDDTAPRGSDQRQAFDLLARGFGPGVNGPLLVVGRASRSSDPERALRAAADAVRRLPGVEAVSAPVFNATGRLAVITVIPSTGPDAPRTRALVALVRRRATGAERRFAINGYVTGPTALNIDTSAKIAAALPAFVAIVVSLAMLLLLAAFRSIVIPLTAVAGFLLTIGATLGVATWVYQDGHLVGALGTGRSSPVISFLPVLVIAVLFGLGMDYEIFLVSRIREAHDRGRSAADAIVDGVSASARVITCAALIMTAVFAGFLSADTLTVKALAVTLAFGILVDAFLIRMTFVPAVLARLADASWWLPRALDRRLPRIDLEGGSSAAPPSNAT